MWSDEAHELSPFLAKAHGCRIRDVEAKQNKSSLPRPGSRSQLKRSLRSQLPLWNDLQKSANESVGSFLSIRKLIGAAAAAAKPVTLL
jgi:hypothetical protein